ncbi:unnamed protein product [Durusdinium trenchii]|uniref:Pentatricopeptide repeat-containing protein n=1 Tax=Durusdinium trenchii TaxID=1381693 RepID=A0ABP0PQM5_9DINO
MPTTVPTRYTNVIDSFSRNNDPTGAERYLQKMVEEKLQPDEITYTSVLSSFARAANSQKAQELLDTMRNQALAPDVVAFTALANAFAKRGDLDGIRQIFGQLATASLQPNLLTWTAALSACRGPPRRPREAEAAVRGLLQQGLQPDDRFLKKLEQVLGAARANELAQSFQLRDVECSQRLWRDDHMNLIVILVSQWAPYNSMAPLALEPAEAPIDVGAERVAEVTVLRGRLQQMERENTRLANDDKGAPQNVASSQKQKNMELERANEQLQYLRQDLLSSEDERKRLKLTLQSQEQDCDSVNTGMGSSSGLHLTWQTSQLQCRLKSAKTEMRPCPEVDDAGQLLLQELAKWEALSPNLNHDWYELRAARPHGLSAAASIAAFPAGARPAARAAACAATHALRRVAECSPARRQGARVVSGLLDERLKTVQADLIFARHKPKGARKIDYDLFLQALAEVALKKDLLLEEAMDRVCLAHGDEESQMAFEDMAGPERFFYDKTTYTGIHKCSGTSQQLANRRRHEPPESWASREDYDLPKSGPERFYYDRSTYTGTHKNNGPSAAGSGVGKEGYSDLSVLVRRDVVQDDVLQRRRRSKTTSSPTGSGTLPTLLGGQQPSFNQDKVDVPPQPEKSRPEPRLDEPPRNKVQATMAPSAPMSASYVKDPTPSYTTQSSPGFGPPAYVPPVLTQQPRPGMGPSGVVGAVGIAAPAPTMAPAPMRSYGYPAPMMQRWIAPQAPYKAF